MPALSADWGGGGENSMYSDSLNHNKSITNKFHLSGGLSKCKAGNGVIKAAVEDMEDGMPLVKNLLYDASKLMLQWNNKLSSIGAGFSNMGNTCFLNSVLQCLCYTAPLTQYLMAGHKTDCQVSGFCMLCALLELSKNSFNSPGQTIKPLNILQNLRSIAKSFSWGHQEDAHEFLRYVVDSMQKSCLTGLNGLDEYSKGTSVVHQIFGGYLRSQVKCDKCQYTSNTYDPMLDISIDLKNCTTIEQALKKFVQPERLDIENAYKCERCKVKVTAQKKFTVHKPPNILTVHLKRFDSSRLLGAKISHHITFSHQLDLRPYTSHVQESSPIYYHLYGVLVHSGSSCNSGHYYCYIRAPNSSWYCMNDSTVTTASLNTVLSAEAYILFYVKSVNKSHVNGLIPHTITKADAMNGGGDHESVHKKFIGPQLPDVKSQNTLVTTNKFYVTNGATRVASDTVSRPGLTNGAAKSHQILMNGHSTSTKSETSSATSSVSSLSSASFTASPTCAPVSATCLVPYTDNGDESENPCDLYSSCQTEGAGNGSASLHPPVTLFTPRSIKPIKAPACNGTKKDDALPSSEISPIANGKHDSPADTPNDNCNTSDMKTTDSPNSDSHNGNGDTRSKIISNGVGNTHTATLNSGGKREPLDRDLSLIVKMDADKASLSSKNSANSSQDSTPHKHSLQQRNGSRSERTFSQSPSYQSSRKRSRSPHGHRRSSHRDISRKRSPHHPSKRRKTCSKSPKRSAMSPRRYSRSPQRYRRSPICRRKYSRSPRRKSQSPRSSKCFKFSIHRDRSESRSPASNHSLSPKHKKHRSRSKSHSKRINRVKKLTMLGRVNGSTNGHYHDGANRDKIHSKIGQSISESSEKKPLLSSSSSSCCEDSGEYQWVEVTKHNLKPSSLLKEKTSFKEKLTSFAQKLTHIHK